jgi:response regulator RpfG family c-di-GMP phosphodiesterase
MKSRTLLLVDEQNVVSSLKRLLRRDGYHILSATHGNEALDLLKEHDVGVIISDQRMQGMTGIEFLAQVRASYADSIRIVLSGFNDLDTVADAVNKGHIFKFIPKPWDDEQLRITVREAFEYLELRLENKRLTQELQAAHAFLTQRHQETSGLLEEIVAHDKDGIVVIDENRQVIFSNPAAIKLLLPHFGVLPGDVFRVPFQDNEVIRATIAHENNQKRVLHVRASTIIRDRKPAHLINLFDITEQIQMEKLRAKADLTSKNALLKMVNVISLTIEKRDPLSQGHQAAVSDFAVAIALHMELSADIQEGIKVGGLVHNIGEIYVPQEILNHQGPLTAEERSILQQHPQTGYEILSSVDFPWPVAEMVLQHHEHVDGSGYPQGLKGEQIIIEARILAVADATMAMLADRPYRNALGLEAVLAELDRQKGTHFDPTVVRACLNVLKKQEFQAR